MIKYIAIISIILNIFMFYKISKSKVNETFNKQDNFSRGSNNLFHNFRDIIGLGEYEEDPNEIEGKNSDNEIEADYNFDLRDSNKQVDAFNWRQSKVNLPNEIISEDILYSFNKFKSNKLKYLEISIVY